MSANFKKCMFGGFDPEDVIAYIDRTAKENKAKIDTLAEENDALTKSNQEMQGELLMLRQQFAEYEKNGRTAEQLQQELQNTQEKLQKLEEEAVTLRAQADEFRMLKDHIADIEISAHRRSEEFRAATVARMQEIITKQRDWCDEAKEKYMSVTEQFAQKLQQAQQVLSNPDISGFAEMEESLRNLENSMTE